MDYAYLCKKIGDMSSIPIRLYMNNKLKMFAQFMKNVATRSLSFA